MPRRRGRDINSVRLSLKIVNAGEINRTYMAPKWMILEPTTVSKQYLGIARTLLRIARNMTDQTIASRLKALAEDHERRAQKAEIAESAEALSPIAVRVDTVVLSNSR